MAVAIRCIPNQLKSLKNALQKSSMLLASWVKPVIQKADGLQGLTSSPLLFKRSFSQLGPILSRLAFQSSCPKNDQSNLQSKISLLNNPSFGLLSPNPIASQPSRSVIKFSLRRGRRKSVHAVLLRFYRLNSGLWIHPIAGRKKHLWKKNNEVRRLYQKHVFATKKSNRNFEKMVQGYWKKPKYYMDDPFEPYHVRNNFLFASNNRKMK